MSENLLLTETLYQEYHLWLPKHATFTQEATFGQLDPNSTVMWNVPQEASFWKGPVWFLHAIDLSDKSYNAERSVSA